MCDECGYGQHAAYPHENGTHYDCHHCETNHHESAGVACVCSECQETE